MSDLIRLQKRIEIEQLARAEMFRQDSKWGPQSHCPERWMTILMEEVGEAADAANAVVFDGAKPEDIAHMEDELIQVAAVAMQAANDLRNQRLKQY